MRQMPTTRNSLTACVRNIYLQNKRDGEQKQSFTSDLLLRGFSFRPTFCKKAGGVFFAQLKQKYHPVGLAGKPLRAVGPRQLAQLNDNWITGLVTNGDENYSVG